MPQKMLFIIIGLVLLFSTIAIAVEKVNPTPEQKKILDMIQAIEENPLREDWKSFTTQIVNYATNSKDCDIVVGDEFIKVNKLDYKHAKIVAFFYMAGCIRFDLLHPRLMNDENAEKVAGVESMATAYGNIIKRQPTETHPFLDELLRLKTKKKLNLKTIGELFKK